MNKLFIHSIFLLVAIGFALNQGLLDCISLMPTLEKNAMLVLDNHQSDAETPIDFQDDGDETLDKDFFIESYIAIRISTSASNKHNHLWAVANWKNQPISLHLPPPKG